LTERLAERRAELLMRQKMLKDVIRDLAESDPSQRLGRQEFFRRLKDQVSELEAQHKDKIAEVMKIRRFKEGLEKLRAEAKAQFIEEQEKLAQKELDETANVSFVRKALS